MIDGFNLSTALVSVIVPAFNAGKFIEECLSSIRQQTHTKLEILVVDDGSTDDTAERVKRHAAEDSRIALIQRVNGGPSAARNTGLRQFQGQFVSFFDADDVLYPESVARRLSIFEERPQTDIVYSDIQVVDAGRRLLNVSRGVRLSARPQVELLTCPCMGPQGVLLRREAVEAIGAFDETLRHGEDWDYWIRLANAGKIFYYLPEVLCEYRRHGSNITLEVDPFLNSQMGTLKKHRPHRRDKAAWRAWKQGMYGIYRNWHWNAWHSTPGLIGKFKRIASASRRHPGLLAAFPFVVAQAISKRLRPVRGLSK